jgi:signal transduction histidine kinase
MNQNSRGKPTLNAVGMNAATLVLAVTVLLVAAVWGSLFFYLEKEKAHAYASAEKLAGNLARTFQEHTVRTIRGIDQTTKFVKNEYERNGRRINLQSYTEQDVILERFLNLIGIADENGVVLMTDRPLPPSNVADREHFKVHMAEDTGKLFISKPVLGRSSGKWSVQFARRINKPDGSFGGIVVSSLDPNYFSDFYSSVDIGEGGAAGLVGTDGIVRTRRSGNDSTIGQDISQSPLFAAITAQPAGHIVVDSSIDNIRRLYAWRKLESYPLVAVVGVSEDVILEEYHEHGTLIRIAGGVMTLTILIAALAVLLLLRNRSQVEESLRRNEQDALSASRMKSEFLARMSHELRTPLNGILGFSELLRDRLQEPESRLFAETIHQAGEHLLSLVNTTLDLAKIEAGHMSLAITEEALQPLVQRAAAIHKSPAQKKGLALETVFEQGLPQALHCDATKVVQVLNNLLHNAIKFTEQGSVTLSVRPTGEGIVFAVADTGAGIPLEQQASLFMRFRQLDSFATRTQQGSGLGLALARELVELMGGRIWVESAGQGGTTFLFVLPAGVVANKPANDPSSTGAAA